MNTFSVVKPQTENIQLVCHLALNSISKVQMLITYIFMFMTWPKLSLWDCTDPDFSLSHQVTLYFITFYLFLLRQCSLINLM